MCKKGLAIMLGAAMMLSLAACGGEKAKDPAAEGSGGAQNTAEQGETAQEEPGTPEEGAGAPTGEEIKIPIILTTGANDALDIQMRGIIEDFNKEYQGTYQMEPEYLAGSADDYRSKLKMLNASNSMPALITIANEPAFYELLVENNRLVDVAPYLEEDPEWKGRLMPQGILEFTREDGSIYTIPDPGMSLTGFYYNKELFAQAGISEFPKTWEEFWAACEALKEQNIPALSLHTTETAWCPMLLATSYLGGSEEGRRFMTQQFPDDFQTPEMKAAMEILVKQFSYTTADAVGGTYALAANNFFSGNTAMIANGPWMMPSLKDEDYAQPGFEEKVGYAPFPGNVMIGSAGGWCVTTDQGEDIIEGAITFMKFYSRKEYAQKRAVESGDLSPVVEFPKEEYEKLMPPMKDCVDVSTAVDIVLPNYQTKWDPVIQNDVFGREIPNLISGSITVEEFLKMLNDGAAQYKEDIQ
ncbi:MAG: extracellular solute-binding protein [Lachnospiraceae bacterium]|nr:extracellular solute-binding protein [Lachnospiraceae bacterium]